MTDESDPGEAGFRTWVHAELTARLGARRSDRPVSVLGAGNDDLDAGRRYLEALAGSGLAVPAWPREYGGLGATPAEVAVVRRELADFDVPDLYPYLVGLELIGPTLLAHATPAQCARWLPPIAAGVEIWCQLFSEPDAGSDLAGLATRAHAEGDEWRLHGQKVWTSRGAYAHYGLMLARHDPAVAKHQGITAFGIDMRTPGLHVRPLRQMNGDAHFTEVFLDDARCPDADRIGTVGEGWRVALTCLSFERGAATAGSSGGLLDVDRLIALAQTRGLASDPCVRDALARLVIDLRVMAMTIRRARDTARTGQPGPAGSGLKLRGSRTFRDYTSLALRILGADALTATEPWNTLFLTAPSLSIRGGTDEIQRNIVGERVLGLPEEPRLDRNVPFEQLPR
jgi:alkylation response protein AidB-like acyl-CoA dehydrogenase